MPRILGMDVETTSAAPIRKVGAAVYIEHPSTRIIMMAYKFIGEFGNARLWLRGDPVPQDIIDHVASGGLWSGWNVLFFDRGIYRRHMMPLGFPEIPDDNWRDSMQLAASANLPRSLDGAGRALGVHYDADKKNNAIISRITDQTKTPITIDENGRVLFGDRTKVLKPDQIEHYDADMEWLKARCLQDVEMEEAILLRLPPWPDCHPWLNMPFIDRGINDRGVLIDIELCRGMARAAAMETGRLDTEINRLTNGKVEKTSQIERLKNWLLARGMELPLKKAKVEDEDSIDLVGDEDDSMPEKETGSLYRLRKNDIANLLALPTIPDDCRHALYWRMEAAKASVRKLNAMEERATMDGRLHGTLSLMGAQATGRFGSGGAQLHNLVRDAFAKDYENIAKANGLDFKKDKAKVKQLATKALATAIEAGRTGDPDLLRMMYECERTDLQGRKRIEGVLPWVSRMMRRTIAAPEGQLMLNADFSNIQARIPVWLAGQEETVQAFRDGKDLYRIQAAPIYGKRPEELTSEERQIGKVQRLFLSFAAGAKAFIPAAMTYGIVIDPETAVRYVKIFRETNPELVQFWDNTLNCAMYAVNNPGVYYAVAPKGLISWIRIGDCLCCRLPSGRFLRYWEPRIETGFWPDGRMKNKPDLTVLVVKGPMRYRRTLWRGLACIGQKCKVITCHGVKNLLDVRPKDKLWDGEQWVSHDGVVFQGVKNTFQFGGIPITPDHKVDLNGQWRESGSLSFADVVSSYERYYRHPDWNADCCKTSRAKSTKTCYMVNKMRLRERKIDANASVFERRCEILWMRSRHAQNRSETLLPDSRNVSTSGVCCMGLNEISLWFAIAQSMEKLWRQRNYCLSEMVGKFREFLGGYGTDLSERAMFGTKKQQREIFKRELFMGVLDQSKSKQTQQYASYDAMGRNADFGSRGESRLKANHGLQSNQERLAAGQITDQSTAYEPTFDILNAGPNHRFTVVGENGELILISNCQNLTCGIEADLLCNALVNMDRNNIPVSLHVHDSVSACVPEDRAEDFISVFHQCMVDVPSWADGLPVAAECDISARFG